MTNQPDNAIHEAGQAKIQVLAGGGVIHGDYEKHLEQAGAQVAELLARVKELEGKLVASETEAEICEMELDDANAQLATVTRELAIANKKAELADRLPFCPDHRDKVAGKECRECEIERLKAACELVNAKLPKWTGINLAGESLPIDGDQEISLTAHECNQIRAALAPAHDAGQDEQADGLLPDGTKLGKGNV